jgi:pyruvate dehydrogenase E1 component alpha subunit
MNVLAELFGRVDGTCRGKGGSMHFYKKDHHFWGGAGIVGAQVPVGAGLALANKQATPAGQDLPVVAAMYGDGAANQGQIWEAANMAKLWGLPLLLVCENNQYGMGTSSERSSANTEYYKQGGVIIPGIQIDGMDVLAVKAGTAYAKSYAGAAGSAGPLYVEYKTYRYHGHSMSDPGITYRTREEVSGMRTSRDCIDLVKARLLDAGWATEASLKATEKDIRADIAAAVAEAKASPVPPANELIKDILHNEIPDVRMPNREVKLSA